MLKLRPLGSRIVIQAFPIETKTKSGILLPESVKEEFSKGTVVSVGPGGIAGNGQRITPEVKAGDVVLYKFSEYADQKIELDNEEYQIVSAESIIAVLDK